MKKLLFIILLILPFNSFADSDGVFCIGSGYVALETRNLYIYEKQSNGKYGIFIIKANEKGLSDRMFIAIDWNKDYNKQISCEEDRVLLSDGFEGNIVDLTTDEPKVTKAKIEENTKFSDKQLPFIRKSETLRIPSEDKEHTYWLLMNYHVQTPSSPPEFYSILHHFSARVVKLNKYGHPIDWKHLAYGITEESWGE